MRRGVEYGQQVDLLSTPHQCRARWRNGWVGTSRSAQIFVGVLDDGRWYVDLIAQVHTPARAYSTKEGAWRVVRNLMASRPGDEWVRIACNPTGGHVGDGE